MIMPEAAGAPGMSCLQSQLCREVGRDVAFLGSHLLPRSARALTAHPLVDGDHTLISQVCFNVVRCSLQGAKTHPKLNCPPESAM